MTVVSLQERTGGIVAVLQEHETWLHEQGLDTSTQMSWEQQVWDQLSFLGRVSEQYLRLVGKGRTAPEKEWDRDVAELSAPRGRTAPQKQWGQRCY